MTHDAPNLRFTIYDLRFLRNLKSKIQNPWLVLIILVGVGLRLWLISFSPLNPSFSTADDGDYYHRAFQFAVTGRYIDDGWLIRPPLHILFFAFWLRLAVLLGHPQLGVLFVQLAQTAIGAITIMLGYGVARRLFANTRAGLLFAAFLALWFPFVEQPSVFFSELLYLFLFMLHYWLLLRFDASNHRRDLALSGVALGAAALTRSPALYSLVFVVLWLLLRPTTNDRRPTSDEDSPWSNMRQLPQADRQAYALAHVRKILAADPLRPFRPMWSTFLHIWKAQYVEDFFVKQSFFTRPLRETAALGLFGDLIWFVYTLGGLAGLVAPAREGLHNRLFVLAWLGYSLLTVLVFHVEPRYLLPIWTLLGLYGAGTLSSIRRPTTDDRRPTTSGHRSATLPQGLIGRRGTIYRARSVVAQIAVVIGFLALLVTYRDYPQVIAVGLARERAISAGEWAYTAGDYTAAERFSREALTVQPDFIDAQVDLALALAAQGRRDEAAAVVAHGGSRRADLVNGSLTLRGGDSDAARSKLTRIEATAGEEVQAWALEWLRPPPTADLHLGDQRDLGYIAGFSRPEEEPGGSFRWLTEAGRVVLPLPEPLRPDATLSLRMSGGRPGETPLDVRIGAGPAWRVPVGGGQWHIYRLPVSPELAGTRRITIELRAPAFIPAYLEPSSDDLRVLSLRISDVRIE